MTMLEEKFMETVPYYLGEIAKQLKISNKLKALELKGRTDLQDVSTEMVDDIIDT